MATLLQEMIDAPEQAAGVPDGWIRAVDEAMVVHHIGIADRADSYEVAKKKLNALLVINSDIERYFSEPPADVARDAELTQQMSRDCEHGQLARSCNICDLEQELKAVTQQRDKLQAALESLVNEPQDITTPAYQNALAALAESAAHR